MTSPAPVRLHAAAIACAIAAPMVLLAQSGRSVPAPPAQRPVPAAVTFTDVTAAAGIRFRHNSGAFGRKYLPETMGSGAAVLDVDADGWQDVFFVNSTRFPGRKDPASYPALYRNNRDGTFTDITRAAGLLVEMYGMGAAAADYDNDGRTDLYVTALGANRLFRNAGGLRFVDVTARAGVGDSGFSTSVAWLDYNRDGVLDLFVANYVEWSPQTDLFCTLDGTLKSYCTPESYQGHSSTLYRGKGDGTFEDVTRAAGIYDPNGKALGVALIDYDNDGWMDLFVAHDTQPNRLYRNLGNGRFRDVGLMAGVAFSEVGAARAGMGVDAADYDDSGRQSLIVGNFSNEMMALYTNEGTGLFIDEAPASTIGKASLLTLTFGAFFFDYDLDGRMDIFAANGHVADDISRVQPNVKYAQPPHLFRNAGGRRFEDVTRRLGADFARPMVARGAAYADYDADGDLDVIVTTNNGPARLLRNDGGSRNRWIRVSVIGTRSNRSGIGTRVQAIVGDKRGPWAYVKTGSSYCSQSEMPVTLGLESAQRVSLRLTWPDGRVETIGPLETNRAVTVTEGRGMAGTQ
jgi:enediyne biosynthesis protein E4